MTILLVAHGLQTGHGPIQLTNVGGLLPAGLELETDYFAIRVDADNFQFASSLADAINGVAINFTDAGSGTHSFEGSLDGDPDKNGSDWVRPPNNAYLVRAVLKLDSLASPPPDVKKNRLMDG